MHEAAGVSWGCRAVKALAVVSLLGAASPALGQDLIGSLQAKLTLYEWTMQAVANDASLCEGLVSELGEKIDRSASASERADLKGYLKTARRCEAKTRQVIREGAALSRRCAGVLDDLHSVDDALAGSNAARRRSSVRRAAGGCVAEFGKWEARVEDLKSMLNAAVDIIRAT